MFSLVAAVSFPRQVKNNRNNFDKGREQRLSKIVQVEDGFGKRLGRRKIPPVPGTPFIHDLRGNLFPSTVLLILEPNKDQSRVSVGPVRPGSSRTVKAENEIKIQTKTQKYFHLNTKCCWSILM